MNRLRPPSRHRSRRHFLTSLGLSLGTFGLLASCGTAALPDQVSAGRSKIPRIGWLGGAQAGPNFRLDAFRLGMLDLGYVEGQDFDLDYRLAEPDQFPAHAAELVIRNVDLIIASGTQASLAAKQATITIPIVMGGTADPVGVGLVASLARPGGNVTGMTLLSTQVSGKRLQILTETLPGLARVAVFFNPDNPLYGAVVTEVEVAAQELGVQLRRLEIRGPGDFEGAFASAATERVDALFVPADQLTTNNRGRIVELAARSRTPALYELREFPEDGGFMSYGPNVADLYRRAAVRHVDKILKGAKPADLPVEQPTTFDLVVNLKTAQALGLTIPPSVVQQATEVIQ
jgi:putative tryptophan/tyrosine transport system substrate-binding protein